MDLSAPIHAPALLGLAAMSVVLATATNWLSLGFLEQGRNAMLCVIPIQGAVLGFDSAGWLTSTTDGDALLWSFGAYALTLALWWAVDVAERVSAKGHREGNSLRD
jgi:hypothetical protein